MRTSNFLGLALVLVAGCATTYEPTVPVGYAGPTARIADQGFRESSGKADLFYIEAIDGKQVANSLQATRRATAGHGFSVSLAVVEHTVPIKPLALKLVGTHITGAPIQEIASRAAGTFLQVEGVITFTPVEGGLYFVTGRLEKGNSAVWIVDAKTEQRISEEVKETK